MTEPTEFLRVSYSSLNTKSTCDRKFEFSKIYPKRARIWEDTYAADVGKALHEGYQTYLTTGNQEEAIFAFMLKFPYMGEWNQSNDYRSFEASLMTLETMFLDAKMEEWELAQIKRPNTPDEIKVGLTEGVIVPAIEVPFELRFKGITLPDGRGVAFTGFIDAVLRSKWQRHLYRTMDIKTSRQHLDDATPKYKFDSQQVPYGIVIEHISQAAVESFEVLYLDCYIDLLEPDVKLYEFQKTQQDIVEWCTNKMLQIQSIKRYMEADYFPRTDSGCMHWNRACPYMEPCMSRDRAAITEWFLLGEEPAKPEEFHPWIVAEIDLGEMA